MKTFITSALLTLSVGAFANTSNTMSPGYSSSSKMNQQKMEETKSKTRTNANGSASTMEKTTTKETPMMDNTIEKESTHSTHKNTKKVR
jgi:hypothetical protein